MKRQHSFLIITIVLSSVLAASTLSARKPIQRGLRHSHLLHSRGSGDGSDSFEALYGEKLTGAFGSIYGMEPAGAQESVYIIKQGDLNGDGMDEIIAVYHYGSDLTGDGLGDNSLMIVYDGNDGSVLFTKAGTAAGYGCYLIEIGDFDGDGKDEIVHVRHAGAYDANNDHFADGSFLEIIKINDTYDAETGTYGYDNIWHYTYQFLPIGGFSDANAIYLMKKGDYDGDGKDELAIVYNYGADLDADGIKDNSFLIVFENNSLNGGFSTLYTKEGATNNYHCYMLESGDFNGDLQDELIQVCHYGTGIANGSFLEMFDDTGNDILLYSPQDVTSLNLASQDGIYLMKKGDFDGDGEDELAVVHHYGNDVTGDGLGDNSQMIVWDGVTISFTKAGGGTGYGCYLLDVGDFNRNDGLGKDEIVYVRHSGSDPNGDHIGDSNFLEVLKGDGSGNIWYYSPPNAGLGLLSTDGIYLMRKGDFDGDGEDELAVVHNCDSETKSMLVVFGHNNTRGDFDVDFDQYDDGFRCRQIEVLENDYTDKELLRSLNSSFADFSAFYSDFMATSSPPAVYLNYSVNEFYYDGITDMFVDSIQNFSTTSFYDDWKNGGTWRVNYIRGAADRLDRIYRTLLARQTLSTPLYDEKIFKYGIKQILSSVRMLSQEKYYIPDITNNQAILYYNRQFLYALPFLSKFKELSYWENLTDSRIADSIAFHLLADGMHDEYSFSYGFYWCYTLGEIADFKERNYPTVFASTDISTHIRNDVIPAMYNYFLYAIKPVHTVLDSVGGNHLTDLPLYGDTFAPIQSINGWLGKKKNGNTSILEKPMIYPVNSPVGVFIDPISTLGGYLDFACDGSGGTVPNVVSKFFSSGGKFISRSNWATASGDYDYDARYAMFSCNKIWLPTPTDPGTTSAHHHADLLNVELSGYDHNIMIDPSGYGVHSGVDSNDFATLYGYDPAYGDAGSYARHYFAGTAAHNTVYIDQKDQLELDTSYLPDGIGWTDRENLIYEDFSVNTNAEFDFAKAGYHKTDGNYEQHIRKFLYLKPLIDSQIKNDYWVFFDKVTFQYQPASVYPLTEQIWHIAPEQNPGQPSISGVVSGDNFWMLPVLNTSGGSIVPVEIDDYYSPLYQLINAKTIKYRKTQLWSLPFTHLTVVFPFSQASPLQSATISKVTVYKNGQSANDWEAQEYHLTFTIGGQTFHDFCLVSHSPGQTISWHDGNTYSSTTNSMEFRRYTDQSGVPDTLIKSLSLN